MLRHRAYMVTFVPSMLRCSVAEIKPGARLTKPSVARVRRSISRCWLACVTVNTLMNVTVLSFSGAIVTSTPLIAPSWHAPSLLGRDHDQDSHRRAVPWDEVVFR